MKKCYPYTEKKLFEYLHTLATHEGNVRERIAAAFTFTIPVLVENDFPQEQYAEWVSINKEIRKFGPHLDVAGRPIISDIENSMRKMKNKTATRLAKKIFDLYFKIKRLNEDGG
jgi:hypothetical protein